VDSVMPRGGDMFAGTRDGDKFVGTSGTGNFSMAGDDATDGAKHPAKTSVHQQQ
ncbi:unnamed protein product, partial [Didymodactylos carnosus]